MTSKYRKGQDNTPCSTLSSTRSCFDHISIGKNYLEHKVYKNYIVTKMNSMHPEVREQTLRLITLSRMVPYLHAKKQIIKSNKK